MRDELTPIEEIVAEDRRLGLPARPGTEWEMREVYPHTCARCGREYRDHGGRGNHLACPAPRAAWDAYFRELQLATAKGCVDLFERDLARFDPVVQRGILDTLRARLDLKGKAYDPTADEAAAEAIADAEAKGFDFHRTPRRPLGRKED